MKKVLALNGNVRSMCLGLAALAVALGPVSAAQGTIFGPSTSWPGQYNASSGQTPDAFGFVGKSLTGATADELSSVSNGILTIDNSAAAGYYTRWSVGQETPLQTKTFAVEFRYKVASLPAQVTFIAGMANKTPLGASGDNGDKGGYLLHNAFGHMLRLGTGDINTDRSCGGACTVAIDASNSPSADFRTIRIERIFDDAIGMANVQFFIDDLTTPVRVDDYTSEDPSAGSPPDRILELYFGTRHAQIVELEYFRWTNVPEPTSLSLLGLGGVALLRRKR